MFKFLRKRNFIFSVIVLNFLFYSCTGVNLRTWPIPVSPNTHPLPEYAEASILFQGGMVYTNESKVSFSNSATKLLRKGTSCIHSLLYLVAWGDASIEAARVEGAVAKVGFIEQEVLAILGFVYHRHCTIVMGE